MVFHLMMYHLKVRIHTVTYTCSTALVAHVGMLGVCGHYTVIGYSPYIRRQNFDQLTRKVSSQPRRSHLSVVASLFLFPSLPHPAKEKHKIGFFHVLFCF